MQRKLMCIKTHCFWLIRQIFYLLLSGLDIYFRFILFQNIAFEFLYLSKILIIYSLSFFCSPAERSGQNTSVLMIFSLSSGQLKLLRQFWKAKSSVHHRLITWRAQITQTRRYMEGMSS